MRAAIDKIAPMMSSESIGASPRRWGLPEWLVVIGLALRVFHFLGNYTIWYDESVLLFNVLDKDYCRLTGPLDHAVAAPPIFVWTLRWMGTNLGDHPYIWRGLPTLFSIALLLLTYRMGRRFFPGIGATTLTGLVALSDGHIWQGINIKPYILDAFFGTLLIYLFLATQDWRLWRRLGLFALLAPPIMSTSYPGAFLYGSVLLAFLPIVWRDRSANNLLAYIGLGLVVLCTFAILYFGPMQAQRDPGLVKEWINKFPNFSRPLSVPGWSIGNAFLVWHYCYNPIGAVCGLIGIVAVVHCVRKGRADLAVLGAAPTVLCYAAACVKAYPFSNNRLILFIAPSLGMLVAIGVPVVVTWLNRRHQRAGAALIAMLLLAEGGACVQHVVKPWPRPDSSSTARYIREHQQPGDLVASDEAGYRYFFMGALQSSVAVRSQALPQGTRVWVPIDHFDDPGRRLVLREWFPESEWELLEEKLYFRATAFLVKKR